MDSRSLLIDLRDNCLIYVPRSQIGYGARPSFYPTGTGIHLLRSKAAGSVKLIIHLHLLRGREWWRFPQALLN
jgi:hypothetical protein